MTTETEKIYQAEDRTLPLNEMHQKNIDNWLNGDEDFKQIIEYEINATEKLKVEKRRKEAIEMAKKFGINLDVYEPL
jgi:hypothetical protein